MARLTPGLPASTLSSMASLRAGLELSSTSLSCQPTIVDIVVVMLFTHPLLQLLSRRNFFASGHSLSGLNPVSLNAVYQGRGRFRIASGTGVKETKIKSASREAAKRQTIAERKAALEAGERGED